VGKGFKVIGPCTWTRAGLTRFGTEAFPTMSMTKMTVQPANTRASALRRSVLIWRMYETLRTSPEITLMISMLFAAET